MSLFAQKKKTTSSDPYAWMREFIANQQSLADRQYEAYNLMTPPDEIDEKYPLVPPPTDDPK